MSAPALPAPQIEVVKAADGSPLFEVSCNCGELTYRDPSLPWVEHIWRVHHAQHHTEVNR